MAALPRSRVCFSLALIAFGPAMAREVRIDYIAALPAQCRNGCSLQMMDAKSGWLVGRGHSALWETHDEGRTWRELPIPHLGPGVKIRFVSLKEGWMFANSQNLYATVDGGVHWIAQELPQFDGIVHSAWVLPKLGLTWLGGGVYQPSDTP